MASNATCHLCGNQRFDWTLKQSHISVGRLQNWTAMLCKDCTEKLEHIVWEAIKEIRKPL